MGQEQNRQRKALRILIVVSGLVTIACAIIALSFMVLRPTPERILKRMLKSHSEMDAVRMEAQIILSPLIKVPIDIAVTLKRPNMLRGTMELKGTKVPPVLMVSDGKKLWTFVEQWKQYHIEAAPRDTESTWAAFKPVGAKDDHRDNMAAALFCGFKLEGKVKEARLVGTENIGSHKCHVIRLTYSDSVEQLLHVGMQDGFVWQTATKAHLKMPSPLPPVELLIMTKCTSITPNPKLSQDEFTFTPPKDAKMVEVLSPPQQR